MGFRGGARFEWIGLGAGGWSLLGRILRVNHICLICQITCDNVEKLFSCDVPRAFVQRGYKDRRCLGQGFAKPFIISAIPLGCNRGRHNLAVRSHNKAHCSVGNAAVLFKRTV